MEGFRDYKLDTKGTPAEISLYTGQKVSRGEGQFRVQYWMEAPEDPSQRQFPWRCRITVPGGGLQATTEEFAFTAPEKGYSEAVEVVSESRPEAWSRKMDQSYYVRLPDGNYGRVKFNLVGSQNPFFGVEAFINPSGSRNLEYDGAVQPKPAFYE